MMDDTIMNVALNGEVLDDVQRYYLASHFATDGEINEGVKFRMNEVEKLSEGMKKVPRKGYEEIMVPTAPYLVNTWNLGAAAERQTLNI